MWNHGKCFYHIYIYPTDHLASSPSWSFARSWMSHNYPNTAEQSAQGACKPYNHSPLRHSDQSSSSHVWKCGYLEPSRNRVCQTLCSSGLSSVKPPLSNEFVAEWSKHRYSGIIHIWIWILLPYCSTERPWTIDNLAEPQSPHLKIRLILIHKVFMSINNLLSNWQFIK